MKLLKIAARNVNRQKRRSSLLALAMGFGMMIIILVSSFTAGLIETSQESFSSMLGGEIYISGEIQLESGRIGGRIENTAAPEAVLSRFGENIEAYHKRSSVTGSFIFGSKKTGGSLYGVDLEKEHEMLASVQLLEGSLEAARQDKGLILSESVIEEIGAALNERVLFSFRTVTGQANVGEFTIAAIIADGASLGLNGLAYADITALNPLIGLEKEEYQSVSIRIKDISEMERLTTAMEGTLAGLAPVKVEEADDGGFGPAGHGPMAAFFSNGEEEDWEGTRFTVRNLNDYLSFVTEIVDILNMVGYGLFVCLLLITMVGLMNTFRMIMIERTREIGTMRAIGLLQKDVHRLFLLESLMLSIRGIIAGTAGAIAVGGSVSLITFSGENRLSLLLRNGHIHLSPSFGTIAAAAVLLTAISLLAAWLPARKSAALQPADALRS